MRNRDRKSLSYRDQTDGNSYYEKPYEKGPPPMPSGFSRVLQGDILVGDRILVGAGTDDQEWVAASATNIGCPVKYYVAVIRK